LFLFGRLVSEGGIEDFKLGHYRPSIVVPMATTLRHLIAIGLTTMLVFGVAECIPGMFVNEDPGHPTVADMVAYYLMALGCSVIFSALILFPVAVGLERLLKAQRPFRIRALIGSSPFVLLSLCVANVVAAVFDDRWALGHVPFSLLLVVISVIFCIYWAVWLLAGAAMFNRKNMDYGHHTLPQ
jgi:hypothetical protein